MIGILVEDTIIMTRVNPNNSASMTRLSTRARAPKGNMLAVIAAVAFVLMLLLFFFFKFVRITGGYQEQKTAIESAALAAARDLGSIVIQDPYFGFIGLSDSAPAGTGTYTVAGDKWYMSVQSINTILATVRLDMIIADKLENKVMNDCAQRDYVNALSARDRLKTALLAAVVTDGRYTDINGNAINPQQDAINAYNQCAQRMTGAHTRLVPNTLTLSLGCIPNALTNTTVPQPPGVDPTTAPTASNNQQNNCYLAYVDQPYYSQTSGQNIDFVFAATASDLTLVDFKSYIDNSVFHPPGTGTINGLPWLIPSIVSCQADQQFNDTDANGKPVTRVIHAIACAEPMNNFDIRPHPGALTFTFQDGMIPSVIQHPIDLFNNKPNTATQTTACLWLFTSANGDCPDNPLPNPLVSNFTLNLPTINVPPDTPTHPWATDAESVALYDWVRRGGSAVNVRALVDMFSTFSFDTSDVGSTIHAFEFTPPTNQSNTLVYPGTITYTVLHLANNVTSDRISQHQWQAIAPSCIWTGSGTNQTYYDLDIRDNCYQPGTLIVGGQPVGGLHGGEPLAKQWLDTSNDSQSYIAELINGQKAFAAQSAPVSSFAFPPPIGAPGPGRITYSQAKGNYSPNPIGQAEDIKIRLHSTAKPSS